MKTYLKSHMRLRKVFILVLLVLLYPVAGYSLDNDAWNTGLNFHFYPPGARALGMGGAFVGLADDATAAASNPAGIAQLTRMQLAIEGRYVSTDDKDKSFPWSIPGFTNNGGYDTSSELDDSKDLSFGAFTTPLFNNLFNISIFYDKPMSFSTNKSAVQTDLATGDVFQYPSETDISIDEVGLSVAKSFIDGKLMLGVGIGVQFFDLSGQIRRFQSPQLPTLYNAYDVDESDAGVSYRAGILLKPIDNLRLGGSVTIMPKFDYTVKVRDFTDRTNDFSYDSSFDVPDNFSLGAAYNILPNWVVIFEAKYVMYSQLEDGFVISTSYADSPLVLNQQGQLVRVLSSPSDYSLDDVMEIHFGTEYVLNAIQNVPIALRTGFFYEPAHDLKYTKPSRPNPDVLGRPRSVLNNIEANLFDGGDDLWHFTFGTGAVFFNHFQVDIGADITDESRNVAMSMVYQF